MSSAGKRNATGRRQYLNPALETSAFVGWPGGADWYGSSPNIHILSPTYMGRKTRVVQDSSVSVRTTPTESWPDLVAPVRDIEPGESVYLVVQLITARSLIRLTNAQISSQKLQMASRKS